MSGVRIRAVISADDPAIASVVDLFETMHEEMAAHGMRLQLAPDGGRIWSDSISRGLERFGRLAVAELDDEVIGFAHASVKPVPDHLGGSLLGHVGHVYIVPTQRRSGTARALVTSLDQWLADKNVDSVELQVIQGNDAGLAFWRALGYRDDLIQLRKP